MTTNNATLLLAYVIVFAEKLARVWMAVSSLLV